MEGIRWEELKAIDMSLPAIEKYKKTWKNWAREAGEFIFYSAIMLLTLAAVGIIGLILAVWLGTVVLEQMVIHFPR